MVERREARVPRHGTQAPRWVTGLPRYVQAHRVPLHPGACRRSAHPSSGVENYKDPGVNAPRERKMLCGSTGCLKS
jgi:hypothetical protein